MLVIYYLVTILAEPEPNPRDFHTAVCIEDKIYVFGGRGTSDRLNFLFLPNTYSNELWCLDLNTYEWTNVAVNGPKPNGRRSHSACK